MEFFKKQFSGKSFTLYLLGDWHYGSSQCNEEFIGKVINEVKNDRNGYWIGLGDLMENAIVGSKSDVYTQTAPPKDQMDYIVDILTPIKDKGLFLIAGNHEQRTMRVAGIIPETHIATRLGIRYAGFSCYAVFELPSCRTPYGFNCYFHHNYGGGYTAGGKINRADQLRLICPTADAIFSGHFHITSRIPVTWYEPARNKIIKKTGYDYIIGSALEYDGSYAEEKAKKPAVVEHINITFVGATYSGGGANRTYDNRKQIYEIITP